MNTSEYKQIGEQIVNFLELALADRNVERDFNAADSIIRKLLPLLPTDESVWMSARMAVMESAVAAFSKRPNQWGEALKLIAIYFRSGDGPSSHPRADLTVQKPRMPNQEPRYPIRIDLVVPFLQGLLADGSSEQRKLFFEQLDDINVVRALTKDVLPSLELSARELIELLHRAYAISANDMLGGMILSPIGIWAGNHADIAKEVVSAWLHGQPPAKKLTYDAIYLLVVNVAQMARPDQTDLSEWRNDVIQALTHRNDEKAWFCSVWLACSAWPAGTPAKLRHAEMLKHVSRLPERLAEAGLRAIAQDAQSAPDHAIETALTLMKMEPQPSEPEAKARRALLFASVLQNVAWTFSDHGLHMSPTQRSAASLILLDVLPQPSLSALDSVIDALAKTDESSARTFLAQWLLRHEHLLRRQSRTLSETFSALDQELLTNWLINYMVDDNPDLRIVALRHWPQEEGGQNLPETVINAMSPDMVRVLIHEWAGASIFNSTYGTMIIQLGRLRSDVLNDIIPIIIDELIINCPGTCEEGLEIYWKDCKEVTVAYQQAKEAILQRQQEWTKKSAVPELVATTVSYRIYAEIMNRAMQEAMASFQRSGRSLVSQIATTINIIYGSSSVTTGNQKMPFSKYEGKGMEQPQLQHLDKVGAIRLSQMHRARAAEYLKTARRSS